MNTFNKILILTFSMCFYEFCYRCNNANQLIFARWNCLTDFNLEKVFCASPALANWKKRGTKEEEACEVVPHLKPPLFVQLVNSC